MGTITKEGIPQEAIMSKIYVIRGQKIMIDRDIAKLYGVETRTLNQAVKRNIERFPKSFMFQLTKKEMENWVSQFVIPNFKHMGIRIRPYAFTEFGVVMLSSVLKSKKAIGINIQIVETFVKLRQMVENNKIFAEKLNKIEDKLEIHEKAIIKIIKEMREEELKPKKQIGFNV